MRNQNRIKPFMEWLTREWEKNPDYRFGQFLINIGIIPDSMEMWNTDIDSYEFKHEAVREIQTWGTYGKDQNQERFQVLIKDLDTKHIEAILKTETHIFGTNIEQVLKDELKFRSEHL